MSYRRNRVGKHIERFEIVSQRTGALLAEADSIPEARQYADEYVQNPELLFVGLSKDGLEVDTWSLDEVRNGYLERDVVA